MKTETIHLTEDAQVTLTTYLLNKSPELPNADIRPAILIFPGGGYMMCSDREAEPIAMAYLSEGYHAFVLRYSLGEKANFPQPLHDAEAALSYIRSHAEEWGVDAQKIVVCGFSAGGHLAASVSTMGKERPNAAILGYPCILEEMGTNLNLSIPSCEKFVDEQTPPIFIFSTRNDEVVPIKNSLVFANALEEAKRPFELHIFHEGSHGLSLAKPHTSSGLKSNVNPNVSHWFELSMAWLKGIFGDFHAQNDYLGEDQITSYSTSIPLGILWKNEICQKLVLPHLPFLDSGEDLRAAMTVSLSTMQKYASEWISDDVLKMLDEHLSEIPIM